MGATAYQCHILALLYFGLVEKTPPDIESYICWDEEEEKEEEDIRVTICQIPPEIRWSQPMAYEPIAVCIGPLFYSERSSRKLKQMQNYKLACVRKLMPDDSSSDSLKANCLEEMKKMENNIRASYLDEIDMSSDDLAEMMLLDGCFIIHLLLKSSKDPGPSSREDDMQVIMGRCWIWNLVMYDLLLLENQIPFFVIVHLFKLLTTNCGPITLYECGRKLFSSIHPSRANASFSTNYNRVQHLLHWFYLSIPQCPQPTPAPPDEQSDELLHWIPSAKELQDAGVKFKKRTYGRSFLDIKFSDGVMEIPPLQVHDYSNSMFRNLIAFEQCYPNTRCQITIYTAIMDCLLNTPEDARVLHLSGILTNRMTADHDAAHFFSRLRSQVHYAADKSYLRKLCVDVNKYQQSRRHKWKAILFRDHLSNPWLVTSLIAGVILLLLTAAQTFFTIYPFYHK